MAGTRSIVAAIALFVLCSCVGSGGSNPVANVTPTLTSSEKAYVSMVDNDVNAIDFKAYKKFDCKTRDVCVTELQDIDGAVQALINDLDHGVTPTVFVKDDASIRQAARELLVQIEATLAVMKQTDSNFVAASSALDVHPLDLKAGTVVCWPKSAVAVEGGESPSSYVCQ